MSTLRAFIQKHLELSRQLDRSQAQRPLDQAVALMCQALSGGLALLVCGNGGYVADTHHIAGDLVEKSLRAQELHILFYDHLCD